MNVSCDYRQKTIVGAVLQVVAPTGQYDPSKLINSMGIICSQ